MHVDLDSVIIWVEIVDTLLYQHPKHLKLTCSLENAASSTYIYCGLKAEGKLL